MLLLMPLSNIFVCFFFCREICLWDTHDGQCLESKKSGLIHTSIQVNIELYRPVVYTFDKNRLSAHTHSMYNISKVSCWMLNLSENIKWICFSFNFASVSEALNTGTLIKGFVKKKCFLHMSTLIFFFRKMQTMYCKNYLYQTYNIKNNLLI